MTTAMTTTMTASAFVTAIATECKENTKPAAQPLLDTCTVRSRFACDDVSVNEDDDMKFGDDNDNEEVRR